MSEAERLLLQQGVVVAYVAILSARLELLAFYERRGYTRTGDICPVGLQSRPCQPCHLVKMRKDLSGTSV